MQKQQKTERRGRKKDKNTTERRERSRRLIKGRNGRANKQLKKQTRESTPHCRQSCPSDLDLRLCSVIATLSPFAIYEKILPAEMQLPSSWRNSASLAKHLVRLEQVERSQCYDPQQMFCDWMCRWFYIYFIRWPYLRQHNYSSCLTSWLPCCALIFPRFILTSTNCLWRHG